MFPRAVVQLLHWYLVFLAGCWLLSAGVARAGAQPCEAGVWVPLEPSVSPPVTEQGRMVYDSSRQLIVANTPSGTWEWEGGNWTLRATGGPLGVMAFDSTRHYSILVTDTGETWRWDGEEWARIAAGGPSADSMAFDSDRGVAVLYQGGAERRTYEWAGSQWALRWENGDLQLPFPNSGTEMCYDTVAHRIVLQGGFWNFFDVIGATWVWDGVEWVFESDAPRRSDVGLAFDTHRGRRVLFGGTIMDSHYPENWLFYGDTYESSAGMPWQLVDDTGPGLRYDVMMAYDAAREEMVLFGGGIPFPKTIDNFTWVRRRVTIEDGPAIVTHPMDSEVPLHGDVSFTVEATGELLRYQWRKDRVPIQDSDRVEGARTNVLTISDAAVADEGEYYVVVSNPCESVTSEAATLTITDRCPGDFNTDGAITSQDFFAFLTSFFALLPEADFDESGTIDTGDFFAYLDAFFGPCK